MEKKTKILIIGIVLILLSVIFSGCSNPSGFIKNKGFSEKFKVAPGNIINFYNYLDGDITIISGGFQ